MNELSTAIAELYVDYKIINHIPIPIFFYIDTVSYTYHVHKLISFVAQ